MSYRTTQPTRVGKTFTWPLTWTKAACTIIGRRLHAVPDAVAVRLGWEVTATHWGLGRVYRDPRLSARVNEPPARPPRELP
jgi:hypothetical protein